MGASKSKTPNLNKIPVKWIKKYLDQLEEDGEPVQDSQVVFHLVLKQTFG